MARLRVSVLAVVLSLSFSLGHRKRDEAFCSLCLPQSGEFRSEKKTWSLCDVLDITPGARPAVMMIHFSRGDSFIMKKNFFFVAMIVALVYACVRRVV